MLSLSLPIGCDVNAIDDIEGISGGDSGRYEVNGVMIMFAVAEVGFP